MKLAPGVLSTLITAEISRDDIQTAAAAMDPVFGNHQADDYSAFVQFKVCKSLPMVCGPESVEGKVFGIHPAVIERSFTSLQFKQLNNGHRLKMFGADRNAFLGCILQVAFPAPPEGGWVVPATIAEAPSITAFGTLFKQDESVSKILGEHLGGRKKWSVSMEIYYMAREVGIYDPVTNECFDRANIPTKYKPYLNEGNDGRLEVRRNSRNPALVLALGGLTKRIWFSGTGFTTQPAEPTAEIESVAAEQRGEFIVCKLAEPSSDWAPGMPGKWLPMPGGFGSGVVRSVADDGFVVLGSQRLAATPEDPVLALELPNGRRIIRHASTVQRKS